MMITLSQKQQEQLKTYNHKTELGLNEEALKLNQETLTEVKHILHDINDSPMNLKKYIHAQWGSVIGNENQIRLAVLKDEIETLRSRTEETDNVTTIGYIHTTIATLEQRIKELSDG